jgi:hypothetical protein
MSDQMMPRPTSALRDFLEACAALGEARFVLRNCSAFMEMFSSTERLCIGDRWLTIRLPEAHMHVELARVSGVRLRESGEADTPACSSLWFHGRCGSPFLLLILDQTEGAQRAAQEAAFRRLRERFGEEITFEPTEAEAAGATLH